VKSLADLLHRLATRSKIENYATITGLPANYLVLLKREAGSYMARPFPITEFPGIPYEYTELLKTKGIKNTGELFEKLNSEALLAEMAVQTGIPVYRLKELYSLCDLSRITGVGAVFARVIYEAGIRSLSGFAYAEPSWQVEKYRAVITKYRYRTGSPGLDDIRYCIDYARIIAECDEKTV
jgi:nucleotidyltransferase/DNA polymerase involved in DNA repair